MILKDVFIYFQIIDPSAWKNLDMQSINNKWE